MPCAPAPVLIRMDHREAVSGITEHLRALGWVTVQVEALELGDYILGPRVAVERKTAADLAASILDKRLFSQAERLSAAYERPIYLIEGPGLYDASHLHPNAIRGALSYLIVLAGITVLRSESAEDSALLLATMARHAQQGLAYELSLHPKRRGATPEQQMRFLAEDLPGIGPRLARALLAHFGSLEALFSADAAQLAQVRGIGHKTATEIRALLARPYAELPAHVDESAKPDAHDGGIVL
ncbi:MAG: ERCC4 domain-containing protein [Chloroflexota bacterium]